MKLIRGFEHRRQPGGVQEKSTARTAVSLRLVRGSGAQCRGLRSSILAAGRCDAVEPGSMRWGLSPGRSSLSVFLHLGSKPDRKDRDTRGIFSWACKLLAFAVTLLSALVMVAAFWGAAHFYGIGHYHIVEMCVWIAVLASLAIAATGTIFFRLAHSRRHPAPYPTRSGERLV